METLRIDNTDIVFKNETIGKGKLIISNDDFGYNFSYYWGAMGNRNLQEFVTSLDSGYFIRSLSNKQQGDGDLDVKKTFRNIRASIKESFEEEMFYWHSYMEFQKDLREQIRGLQKRTYNPQQLINELDSFSNHLNFDLIDCEIDRRTIESIFKNMNNEIWYLFIYKEPLENIFLSELLEKIKKKLKKELKNA